MSLVYLHLVLNHIPIIGIPVATFFLIHGIFKGNISSRRFALIMLFVISIFVLPVYFTGEPAEEAVEDLPGVMESLIEEHEDAGKISMILTVILGAISFIALFMQKDERKGRTASFIVLIFAAIAISSLSYTGKLGGVIRHTEVQSGVNATGSEQGGLESGGGGEKENEKEEAEED